MALDSQADRLSNDVQMSTQADGEDGAHTPSNGQGVLANLPRTRPQRSSARRAAARDAASSSEPAAAARRPSANGASAGTATGAKLTRAAKPRAAAKAKPKAKAKGTAARAATPKTTAAAAPKPRPRSAPKRTAPRRAAIEEVPRQGFEADGERASGPVAPPGGAEFLATAAEVVSELAKAGLSTGERLVRDVFSRLPLS
jgi:hypothetical protein